MNAGGDETEALVLRRFDFSENSQIARVFARGLGRVSVLGKGIKKPGADLQGPIDLFALADVHLRFRPRSELALLVKYRVRTGFPGLRRSLPRLWAAFYVTEVLREGTRDLDPDDALFDATVATLHALESADGAGVTMLVAWYGLTFLRLSGFMPDWHSCGGCGRRAPDDRSIRVSPARSALLCQSCAARTGLPLVTIQPGARRLLALLVAAAEPAALPPGEPALADLRALSGLVPSVIEHVLEKELRASAFVNTPC